ncbi:NADP-dependent oxidoreductase [Pseudomonas aeruginosa]|nr:NADP-dependent oxidoreductase [Pseudomonas aeruginosa]
MSQSTQVNRRIVLASRPHGAPTRDNFRIEQVPLPEPGAGQVLLRTVYLSLDPYMRGRMSDAPSYAPPVELGAVMVGGTVSRVEASNHPGFKVGDWVLSANGWQDYALSDGSGLARLGESPEHPSYALGLLGMPGFTAYMGLLDIGKPQAGETLVVGAATGPVGATVGQIGKLKGLPGGRRRRRCGKMPPRRAGARLRCLPRPPCRGLRRTTGRGLPGRHRHLLRERRRQGLRRRLSAAQRQGPGFRSAASSPTTTTPTCRPGRTACRR